MSENQTTNQQREQKFFALFATQNGDQYGGDFALSYKDNLGNIQHSLPWATPHTDDMKIFMQLTLENVVVMGFRTFEALGRMPLFNRINVVVASRPTDFQPVPVKPWEQTQLFFVKSVEEAIDLAKRQFHTRDVFFIGGINVLGFALAQNKQPIDGIYHSKIDSAWPQATLDDGSVDIEIVPCHLKPEIIQDYRIVAQLVGRDVKCTYWKRSQVPQTDIEVHVGLVGQPLDAFYEPGPFRQLISKKLTREDVKKTTIPKEMIEVSSGIVTALSNTIKPTTIEAAVKQTKDRGMAFVDPFEVKNVDKEIRENIKDYIFDQLVEKGLVAPPADQVSKETSVVKSDFVGVATEIGELLVVKDAAYGSAFEKTKEIFKILFPGGLPVEAFDDALTIMRILDKICRLGVLCTNPEENKTTERAEDAWKDIAGYSIKALCEQRRRLSADKKGGVASE